MLIQNELRKHPIDRILIAKARQRPSVGVCFCSHLHLFRDTQKAGGVIELPHP
jgi:PIN domain nuclease of toxin-antitoxin system